MEYDTSASQIAIRIIQTIQPIRHTIATLVTLGNKRSADARQMRAILVRHLCVTRTNVRPLRTTTMRHWATQYGAMLLEAPHNKAATTRM